MTLDCKPPYTYRPDFTPSGVNCQAPGFEEHRSRLFAGGTFFRSHLNYNAITDLQSALCNDISLEMILTPTGVPTETDVTLNVRFQGSLVETQTVTQEDDGLGAIVVSALDLLRPLFDTSDYIRLYPRGNDAHDIGGIDDVNGASAFPETNMSGGDSGPVDDSGLASIRTGPERSLIIIRTTENETGDDVNPPSSKRVQQWDGTGWVTYTPNADCVPV